MKAIISTGKGQVALQEVAQPITASAGHIIVKMKAMGINAGDKFFISGNFPPGFFTQSRYDIAGVSGVGKVTAVGEGVPEKYVGKYVTLYRSLTVSDEIVGTWSDYAQLPYLQCAILPDDVNPEDYKIRLSSGGTGCGDVCPTSLSTGFASDRWPASSPGC